MSLVLERVIPVSCVGNIVSDRDMIVMRLVQIV